jgi:peptidoglycan/xylan/chitin deacetylase (PgdA/CDA1 family)
MRTHPKESASNDVLPIPDRLVVLTFDDSVKSQATFVGPLLQQHGFGATFFVTDDPRFSGDHYMTWEEVRGLHKAGFEIGNHLGHHVNVNKVSREQLISELEEIEQQCEKYGIPRPLSFCYPGYNNGRDAVEILMAKGYLFARRGAAPEFPCSDNGDRGPAYDPAEDHPLLIPTTGASGPRWGLEDLAWAVQQAKNGKVAVLTFHGVPDLDHPWVHTEPEAFATYMEYLRNEGCIVIAMRDLIKYVDPNRRPSDPYEPIQRRLRNIQQQKSS